MLEKDFKSLEAQLVYVPKTSFKIVDKIDFVCLKIVYNRWGG